MVLVPRSSKRPKESFELQRYRPRDMKANALRRTVPNNQKHRRAQNPWRTKASCTSGGNGGGQWIWADQAMARSERFELPALGIEIRCSIQLSYERVGHDR